MFYPYVARFDVMGNLVKFWVFGCINNARTTHWLTGMTDPPDLVCRAERRIHFHPRTTLCTAVVGIRETTPGI